VEIARKAAEARWGRVCEPVRSMASPGYKYSPWTPERRKAASEAAKKRYADQRAREEAEYQRERQSASGRLRQIRFSKSNEMNEIAARWHRLKAEVAEIDTALGLIDQLKPILTKYGVNR
jgi:hypothetical protein